MHSEKPTGIDGPCHECKDDAKAAVGLFGSLASREPSREVQRHATLSTGNLGKKGVGRTLQPPVSGFALPLQP